MLIKLNRQVDQRLKLLETKQKLELVRIGRLDITSLTRQTCAAQAQRKRARLPCDLRKRIQTVTVSL